MLEIGIGYRDWGLKFGIGDWGLGLRIRNLDSVFVLGIDIGD